MNPTGEIRDMTVPWLLQDLAAGKKTGIAVFEREAAVKNVYIRTGEVLLAASNRNEDRLGEFLVRKGRITRSQFETASGIVVQTKKKLGAVLYDLGILSPQELVTQVKLQVKDIILDLFNWRSGRYRFEEGPLAADQLVPLRMSMTELIREGIEAVEWQSMRKTLPSVKTVLRPVAAPGPQGPLSADQKNVLALADGTRSIEDICTQAGIGDFNALRAIYVLLALKLVEEGRRAAGGPSSPASVAPEAGSGRVMSRQAVLDAFAALEHRDDFQMLGVNATTPPEELKRAYFRLAKMFHPDRYLDPGMADLKPQLEAIFSRIHESYSRLTRDARPDETGKQRTADGEYEEKRTEDYVENYAEKTKRAAACFSAGMKDFSAGNFWTASEAFAWAIRLDPLKAPYYYHYGLCLARMPRRGHEAEEHLKKAIEIDPLKPEYHLDLGDLYLKTGLKNKALAVYTAAFEANPSEKLLEAIRAAGGEVPKQSGGNGVFKKMFKDGK